MLMMRREPLPGVQAMITIRPSRLPMVMIYCNYINCRLQGCITCDESGNARYLSSQDRYRIFADSPI
jgi:hypothetical protein